MPPLEGVEPFPVEPTNKNASQNPKFFPRKLAILGIAGENLRGHQRGTGGLQSPAS